jgi:DNA repair protein RecN (Recombination protein N)
LDQLDSRREEVAGKLAAVAGRLHELSSDLSARRRAAATHLDGRMVQQLQDLGMVKAHFETRIEPTGTASGGAPAFTASGVDAVEFLLSANPGQAPRPLAKIASGGELSRTMLGLKTVLAQADPTRTLIFDEVDSGISGAMAEVVGHKLRGLGRSHQVLCITHLPQIAAQASHHCGVTKETDGRQTYTRVTRLDEEASVHEVARLLSGIDVTSHALASAREMVRLGRRADV